MFGRRECSADTDSRQLGPSDNRGREPLAPSLNSVVASLGSPRATSASLFSRPWKRRAPPLVPARINPCKSLDSWQSGPLRSTGIRGRGSHTARQASAGVGRARGPRRGGGEESETRPLRVYWPRPYFLVRETRCYSLCLRDAPLPLHRPVSSLEEIVNAAECTGPGAGDTRRQNQ